MIDFCEGVQLNIRHHIVMKNIIQLTLLTVAITLSSYVHAQTPQGAKAEEGLVGSKVTKYDSVAVFVKRDGRILALFPEGPQSYEVYEFSK